MYMEETGGNSGMTDTSYLPDGSRFAFWEQGGFLRVMYPQPETCLNLETWQEFYGFDLNGQTAWFGLELDEDTGKFCPGLWGF